MRARCLSFREVSVGVFWLAITCLVLGFSCRWMVRWTTISLDIRHQVLVAALVTGGMAILLNRARRSYQLDRSLTTLPQIAPSSTLITLISRASLNPSDIRLIRADEPVACCAGLLRPCIWLSTGLIERLSGRQLEAVLYHEGYHLMHRHPLGIWVVESLAALLFFLPVLKEWRDLVKTRMEIEADQHAIQSVGKAALAGALARLVSHSFENTGSQGSRASFHGMASSQVRVAHLLGNRSSALRVTTVSLVKSSAVLWALCLVTML